MKFKKFLVCCIVAVMLLVTSLPASAAFGRTYTAPKGTPTIDGKVDKVWKTAPWTNIDKPYDGAVSTTSEVRVKLLWDDTHIYFLAEMYDESVTKNMDIFEIYLDQNNDKSKLYGSDDTHTRFYVTGGVAVGAGENRQIDAPSKAQDEGENYYILEGALKWPAGKPSVDATMGIEFMYDDAVGMATTQEAFRWNADTSNGDPAPYLNTSVFGTLKLAAKSNTLPDNTYVTGEQATDAFKKVPEPDKNEDTVSKDTVSKDTVSKDTVSKDTVSKDTVSKDTVSKEHAIISSQNQVSSAISSIEESNSAVSEHSETAPSKVTTIVENVKYEDDNSSDNSTDSSGIVLILVIVGAVVALALAALGVFLFKYKKLNTKN